MLQEHGSGTRIAGIKEQWQRSGIGHEPSFTDKLSVGCGHAVPRGNKQMYVDWSHSGQQGRDKRHWRHRRLHFAAKVHVWWKKTSLLQSSTTCQAPECAPWQV